MTPGERGLQIRAICPAAIDNLITQGVVPAGRRDDAMVALFSPIADYLFGNLPIDIPTLRREPARPHVD